MTDRFSGLEDDCLDQMEILNTDAPADQENEGPILNHTKNQAEKRNEKQKEIGQTKSKHSLGKPYD